MNEFVARKLLLPLHEMLRGRSTLAQYRSLRDSERWSGEQLRALQLRKLRRLIDHARSSTLHYRESFEHAGIESGEDVTLRSLAGLAPLERAEVRSRLDAFAASSHADRLIRYSTGGSTGEPLVFYTDKHKESCHNAQKLRARAWFGVQPGDRQADLWGSPIELAKLTRLRILKDRWLLNHALLSAFDLTEERVRGYVNFLTGFHPRLVYGYPTVIYRLARSMLEAGVSVAAWRPRLVSCTSEMLYDHLRKGIQEAFDCPVANEYGSRDAGLIAHECPAGKLHIAAEHVIVEVDKPDENGVGDLLVTNLDGYGMPLIRYRLGDRGRLEEGDCSCGLGLPLLGEVAGRSNDFLYGEGGKLVHSLAPIYVFREIAAVRQFRLTQCPDGSLDAMVVASPQLSENELDKIRQKMWRIFGYQVPVAFRFVDVIPPEKSGKYRWVVCEMKGTIA